MPVRPRLWYCVDAPAKEITDLAGVGVGTLYRHFPRRSDLIIAVLKHEIDECVEAAEELGTTLSPWEALTGWIERFTDFVGTKRGLASALHSGDPAYDDLPQHLMDRLEPALQTLLARAVDGGYARDDVTAREVLTAIALICQPVPGEHPSFNQRMTQVFMEGLGRVANADAEPAEGGGQAEFGAARRGVAAHVAARGLGSRRAARGIG
jgi:AcrR family transcriptional regulator